MKNKKLLTGIAAAAALSLTGIGFLPIYNTEAQTESEDSIRIVAEIFPAYDWTRELMKETDSNLSLSLLLDNGVDLHSYQPTVDDIMTIADSDLLIYVGGETDGWIEDALAEAPNPDRQVINLMELLSEDVKEEETVEGMAAQRGHNHEHSHEEDHDHESSEDHEEHDHETSEDHDASGSHDHEDESDHEEDHDHDAPEYDEHVWLSLRNAEKVSAAIAEALTALDPAHASDYETNLAAYTASLDTLDQKYQDMVANASFDTILFADRFPFLYLTKDYGIQYYAAFAGCAAESEASFETIAFLAGKINELSLPAVLTMEGPDHRIAETIAANTKTPKMPVLTMNSMQATTLSDSEKGVTYLSLMEDNLAVLRQAMEG